MSYVLLHIANDLLGYIYKLPLIYLTPVNPQKLNNKKDRAVSTKK